MSDGGIARGVWAPVPTPVRADFTPAPHLLAAQVLRLLRTGCHGVVLFGTTGEAPSFSLDERRRLLDAVLEAGVPPAYLLVGTGCCAFPQTVELTRHAARAGCAGALMLPPFYFKDLSAEGLYRAFATVFDRLGGDAPPTLLYHFPRLSQAPIPIPVLDRLADAFPDVVCGVKDSSGDYEGLEMFVRARPDLRIFPGTEVLLLPGLCLGAAGVISAGANVQAPALRAVYDAHTEGRGDADALQDAVTAFRLALQEYPMIPAVKRLLAERSGEPVWAHVRPPLVPLSDEAWRELERRLGEPGATA